MFHQKQPPKSFLEVKNLLKLRFLDYFSKAETKECEKKDWSVSDIFEIITSCSSTYHKEVGVPVSLKVATKAYFRGDKSLKI